MKILVAGGRGQLGRALSRSDVISLGRAELDVTNPAQVEDVLSSHAPDVVIDAAGYTAVDAAETNPTAAYAVNVNNAMTVAKAPIGRASCRERVLYTV